MIARAPRRGPWSTRLGLHVLLCAVSLVMLYPLLWMFASSLKPNTDFFQSVSLLACPSWTSPPTPAAGADCR